MKRALHSNKLVRDGVIVFDEVADDVDALLEIHSERAFFGWRERIIVSFCAFQKFGKFQIVAQSFEVAQAFKQIAPVGEFGLFSVLAQFLGQKDQ